MERGIYVRGNYPEQAIKERLIVNSRNSDKPVVDCFSTGMVLEDGGTDEEWKRRLDERD